MARRGTISFQRPDENHAAATRLSDTSILADSSVGDALIEDRVEADLSFALCGKACGG